MAATQKKLIHNLADGADGQWPRQAKHPRNIKQTTSKIASAKHGLDLWKERFPLQGLDLHVKIQYVSAWKFPKFGMTACRGSFLLLFDVEMVMPANWHRIL